MDVISNAIKSYDNSFSYRIGQACVWRIVYADQITLLIIVLVYLVCIDCQIIDYFGEKGPNLMYYLMPTTLSYSPLAYLLITNVVILSL